MADIETTRTKHLIWLNVSNKKARQNGRRSQVCFDSNLKYEDCNTSDRWFCDRYLHLAVRIEFVTFCEIPAYVQIVDLDGRERRRSIVRK